VTMRFRLDRPSGCRRSFQTLIWMRALLRAEAHQLTGPGTQNRSPARQWSWVPRQGGEEALNISSRAGFFPPLSVGASGGRHRTCNACGHA
jgi:hypothetical protein